MIFRSLLGKLLIIPPVLVGGGVLWYATAFRTLPQQKPASETMTSVHYIQIKPQNVQPALIGYGTVKPENIWTGVAQVSGRVEYVNPEFRRGANLEANTELVRISPADHKLAVAEAEAQIRSAEAQLDELLVSEQNTKELLEIEKESLRLKEKAVAAKRALLKRGSLAQLSFDAELRDLLSQKKRVQDLKNTLRLNPTQKVVQQEQIRVNRSKLETAKLNLKRTVVHLPFAARIASVDVEVSQYLQAGTKIGVADGVATAQITAQYPLDHLKAFFEAIRDEFGAGERTWAKHQNFAQSIGLYAVVQLQTSGEDVVWQGRVARFNDTLNEQTRTVGLIVLVDKPYANAAPGKRPPLVKGMFVRVWLRARPLKSKLVVPISALHDGYVFVVDTKNRLEKRQVQIGYRGQGFAVINDGLKAGARLIVSDLSAPLPGMLLKPVHNNDLQTALAKMAAAGDSSQ